MLIGNGLRLASNPQRYLDGNVAYTQHKPLQLQPGAVRGFYNGQATGSASRKSAFPRGYNHTTGAWIMPPKAGDMASTRLAAVTMVAALPLVAGRGLAGATTITWTLPAASLQLIVSGSGHATITWTPAGTLVGKVEAVGATSFHFTVPAAVLGAIANLVGATAATFSETGAIDGVQPRMVGHTTVTLTGAAAIRALGELIGHITPFTDLSPQNLAAAVWNAVAASNNEPDSMGEKLNAAGAAADPWATPEGQAVLLELGELWRIHGLKAGAPMTVTPTSRTADTIVQTITGDGVASTTVTRT